METALSFKARAEGRFVPLPLYPAQPALRAKELGIGGQRAHNIPVDSHTRWTLPVTSFYPSSRLFSQ